MASWVYVFSKFTPEALLFEAFAICILVCAYTAFWILRKRQFGATSDAIPASVVKHGLNQLIGDAETLRAQLFGILTGVPTGGGTVDPAFLASLANRSAGIASGGTGLASDPELLKKLAALEARMSEQSQSLDKIQTEKTRLEQELAQAKTGDGGGGGSGDTAKLNDKIQMLEARLAEYSVIEDDLANLKRLQQENAQLKAALANNGPAGGATAAAAPAAPTEAAAPAAPKETPPPAAASEAPASAPPAPTPTSAAAAPEAAAENSAPPVVPQLEAVVDTPANEPSAPKTAGAASAEPSVSAEKTAAPSTAGGATPALSPADPSFEGLVDSVERSLEPSEPAAVAPKPAPQNSTQASPNPEKSDEDLIAEFEKMLNS